jgi:enediyne biosynthesis thioesterase
VSVHHTSLAGANEKAPPRYRYRHRVSFEETNLMGNVYFARHVSWQGRCRELFLLEHAPEVMVEMERDLRLVTLNVSCEYFAELRALDEIEIRMSLAHLRQNRIGMVFEYVALGGASESLAARGFQEVACMRLHGQELRPCPVPPPLANAVAAFRQDQPFH